MWVQMDTEKMRREDQMKEIRREEEMKEMRRKKMNEMRR
jgi:hypothetical protein